MGESDSSGEDGIMPGDIGVSLAIALFSELVAAGVVDGHSVAARLADMQAHGAKPRGKRAAEAALTIVGTLMGHDS